MIVCEFYRTREDGKDLYKTYSDDNYYIVDDVTGKTFVDAVELSDKIRSYHESDTKLPPTPDEEVDDETALDELLEVLNETE